jgi:hypothetical protein
MDINPFKFMNVHPEIELSWGLGVKWPSLYAIGLKLGAYCLSCLSVWGGPESLGIFVSGP